MRGERKREGEGEERERERGLFGCLVMLGKQFLYAG
jgi:hypothetical protein